MKDKNLRKQLYGHWHSQTNEGGGPEQIFDNKWHIKVEDGIVRHLLKKIDTLEEKIQWLNEKIDLKEVK